MLVRKSVFLAFCLNGYTVSVFHIRFGISLCLSFQCVLSLCWLGSVFEIALNILSVW